MKANNYYFSDDEWQRSVGWGPVPPDRDIKNKELLDKLTDSEILEWLKTQPTQASPDNKP